MRAFEQDVFTSVECLTQSTCTSQFPANDCNANLKTCVTSNCAALIDSLGGYPDDSLFQQVLSDESNVKEGDDLMIGSFGGNIDERIQNMRRMSEEVEESGELMSPVRLSTFGDTEEEKDPLASLNDDVKKRILELQWCTWSQCEHEYKACGSSVCTPLPEEDTNADTNQDATEEEEEEQEADDEQYCSVAMAPNQTCTVHSDCGKRYKGLGPCFSYCNAGKCEFTRDEGHECTEDAECLSGICSSGSCANIPALASSIPGNNVVTTSGDHTSVLSPAEPEGNIGLLIGGIVISVFIAVLLLGCLVWRKSAQKTRRRALARKRPHDTDDRHGSNGTLVFSRRSQSVRAIEKGSGKTKSHHHVSNSSHGSTESLERKPILARVMSAILPSATLPDDDQIEQIQSNQTTSTGSRRSAANIFNINFNFTQTPQPQPVQPQYSLPSPISELGFPHYTCPLGCACPFPHRHDARSRPRSAATVGYPTIVRQGDPRNQSLPAIVMPSESHHSPPRKITEMGSPPPYSHVTGHPEFVVRVQDIDENQPSISSRPSTSSSTHSQGQASSIFSNLGSLLSVSPQDESQEVRSVLSYGQQGRKQSLRRPAKRPDNPVELFESSLLEHVMDLRRQHSQRSAAPSAMSHNTLLSSATVGVPPLPHVEDQQAVKWLDRRPSKASTSTVGSKFTAKRTPRKTVKVVDGLTSPGSPTLTEGSSTTRLDSATTTSRSPTIGSPSAAMDRGLDRMDESVVSQKSFVF